MNLAWLKEFFAGFLRTRHIARHFRRLALLESAGRRPASAAKCPPRWRSTLVAAATSDPEALLQTLDTHADGLTDSQADAVRERVGLNEVEHEKPLPVVAAPVALLQEPVQPAADRAGGRVLCHRGHEGHHRDRAAWWCSPR